MKRDEHHRCSNDSNHGPKAELLWSSPTALGARVPGCVIL